MKSVKKSNDNTLKTLPPCPFLPPAPEKMDWRSLNHFGDNRGIEFYYTALQYGQYLWQKNLSARAILAVDRALFSNLEGNEPLIQTWPLPYQAIRWIIQNNPSSLFIGNPRVHYQHLADRVRGERQEQKKWRTWACWAITRQIKPKLSGDPKHTVEEPEIEEIKTYLAQYGIVNEVEMWVHALKADA